MSKNMSNSTDLSSLASLLVDTVRQCCDLMHKSSSHNDIMMKDGNDPVTEIDYRIQSKIICAIHQHFPTISIVGEEDPEKMNNIVQKYYPEESCPQYTDQTTSIKLPTEIGFLGQILTRDLCIWIDPLDCTRGFIANIKYECTILVGVTYKGKPVLGVIGQPYKKINGVSDYKYDPTITIGSIYSQVQKAYQYCILEDEWKIYSKVNNTSSRQSPLIAISSRRQNKLQGQIMEALAATGIKTGGAGHKILLVIRGQIDAMMFIGVSTSKWDSCAGEAIIKAMGGYLIQPDCNDIPYSPYSNSHLNSQGFICTYEQKLFNQVQDCLKKQTIA